MRTVWGCLVIGLLWGMSSYGAGESASLKATLTEVDASGAALFGFGTHELAMNAREEGGPATSFTLIENGGSRRFAILNRFTDECGNHHYAAFEDLGRSKKMPARLVVIDRSDDTCEDTPDFMWEVTLAAPKEGKRYFRGNPEPVGDGAACLAEVLGTICNLVYAPSTCTVATLDGGAMPIAPAMRASGGNSCQAMVEVRAEACRRGIDPGRIKDADVSCTLDAPSEESSP